jgi:hypothetical protein
LSDAGGIVRRTREQPEETGNGEAPGGRCSGLGCTPWWRCFTAAIELAQHRGGAALMTPRMRRKAHRRRSSSAHGMMGQRRSTRRDANGNAERERVIFLRRWLARKRAMACCVARLQGRSDRGGWQACKWTAQAAMGLAVSTSSTREIAWHHVLAQETWWGRGLVCGRWTGHDTVSLGCGRRAPRSGRHVIERLSAGMRRWKQVLVV